MKKAGVLLLLLFLLPVASAQLTEDLAELEVKVREFVQENPDIIIVEGQHASLTEKATLAFVQEKYSQLASVERIAEEDLTPEAIEGKTVIVIGGPKNSEYSNDLINDPTLTKDEDATSVGITTFLEGPQGRFMVVSDKTGHANEPQTAASRSPLNKVIPEEYVPAAATLVGISFLWFWQLIIKVLKRVFSLFLASKVMKWVNKKSVKDEFLGFHAAGVRLKLREWFAILISASIFAISLGYMYLSPNSPAAQFFLLTIVVNMVVYAVRNGVRLYLDKKHGLHTEYKIWLYGAIVTALTAWLGNTFSLAGYVASDEKENEHEGKHAFIVNFMTFIAFGVFFVLNFLNPSTIYQMVMLLALGITFLQMLPFTPFGGKKVWAWKKSVYLISFIPLTFIYIFINVII